MTASEHQLIRMESLVSVVICTHNPRAEYLRQTLEALRKQTLPIEKWELLLIDNASRERVANTWDISWHSQGRHILEENVGLTFARLRGIEESRSELLIFVDDDNVLAPDFLELAVCLAARHTFLGAFGAGTLQPEFEIPPPLELKDRVGLLALRSVQVPLWSNNIDDYSCLPWGAGLCVTRDVATEYQRLIDRFKATRVIDRQGKHLFSGGDDVFSWAAVAVGRGFGIFPELRITHLISAGRLKRDYFVRLIRDHAMSHGVLNYLRSANVPKSSLGFFRFVHLLLHGFRHGGFSLRCSWAEAQGQAGAARFIAENGLRPVNWRVSLREHVIENDPQTPSSSFQALKGR
jgi:glycosyltransferase involved in cell wall biosynthesis